MGADVAMGVTNGDYSVAQVLDSKRQVATWRGQVHPDYFAEVLYALGMEYNEALVIVENNSHGILTCTRLGKDMAYPAFFTEVQYDKITDRETVKLGFTTTAKTKPLIIDQLARLNARRRTRNQRQDDAARDAHLCGERDRRNGSRAWVLRRLRHVFALANHIHEGAWEPVDVPEELYIEMV